MKNFPELKVAIVHYWFVSRRGGERVVEALCEIFPQADLFALVADTKTLSPKLQKHKLTTSFLQKIPGSCRWHRHLLPLYPLAIEQFDLRGYDLVISQESGPAKGVLTGPRTCHICYCNTPMRYLWDFYHEYRKESSLGYLGKLMFSLTTHYMRMWDQASAARVDYFVANSNNVARRIGKFYRRTAEVIYCPVNVSSVAVEPSRNDHYLMVGQLVRYKRADLAIEACNRLGRKLRIVGIGEEYKRLRRIAGKTIEFLGPLSDEDVHKEYADCRALLFPGEEDFGLVPVEAQGFGRPIIAFGRGGAKETVINALQEQCISPEKATGILFQEQTADSLMNAIHAFEAVERRFSPQFIQTHADKFNKRHFCEQFTSLVRSKLLEGASTVTKEEDIAFTAVR